MSTSSGKICEWGKNTWADPGNLELALVHSLVGREDRIEGKKRMDFHLCHAQNGHEIQSAAQNGYLIYKY